jgi:hypothetical protein
MRVLTALIAVCCALLIGCTHGKEMRFTRGKGDIGPFILEHALKRGARPVATNALPPIGGEWRYSEDEDGVVLQLPREQFDQIAAFLRHTFGPPTQEPTKTTTGGKLGWYAARTIGVGLQFGYHAKRTQVIVLRPARE